MKLFITAFTTAFFSLINAQEISKVEKTKIGKYNYEFSLKDIYFYEDDEYGINYYIRLNEKKQFLGTLLTYRTFVKSRNFPIVDKTLPPNPLLKFNDREITGEGKIEVINDKKEIISTFKKYVKNNESDSDSTKTIYRQKNNGFFEKIFIETYLNGKSKILLKK